MPKKYTLMGLSPFHGCVFSLFLTLFDKYYEVLLNNIYMIVKFVHLLYTHNNCVKVKGVRRTGGKGILREVFQNEFHDKKAPGQVR